MARQHLFGSLSIGLFCCTAVLVRAGASTQVLQQRVIPAEKGTTQQIVVDPKASDKVGGKDRCSTFLSTDKPIYGIGDKVYVRGVMLDATNHKPLTSGTTAMIHIKGPKGNVEYSASTAVQDSVFGTSWEVPEGQEGGEYTITATYMEGYAPAERKFDIRAYRAPRLNSQISFLRDGYGPGEKINATLEVKRAEGGVPAGAKVNVTATINGVQVSGGIAKVDEHGLCSVSLQLPDQISRGEGTLTLTIEDGGVVEAAAKTIPIILQTVDLQLFPEGGELVAGYSNRVYLQARQPNGKPADLVGTLVSKQAGKVGSFHTEHEGRGRFEFTPEPGKEYFLSVSQPASVKTIYPLPKVKTTGAVIHSEKDTFSKGQPVTVQVGCTSKKFRVGLYKKEVEVAACNVDLSKRTDVREGDMVPISFDLPAGIDGVLSVMVRDSDNLPLAERLIFREPVSSLNISLVADKQSYVPGDNASVTVKTTDDGGKPVAAVVGLTVTDESVLEMVEKREQSPRLPVMVFLEPEVKDLADAHVYLDTRNPKASLATDLLLGTQGWRRFALMDVNKFVAAHGDSARRVVAFRDPGSARMVWLNADDAEFGGAVLRGRAVPPAGAPLQLAAGLAPKPAAIPVQKAAPVQAPRKAAAPAASIVHGQLMGRLKQEEVAQAQDKSFAIGGFAKRQAGQAKFFMAPRRLQIIDERPIIRDFREAPNGAFGIELPPPPFGFGSAYVVVREFAHVVRPGRKPGDRVDFGETLFWNAGVKTNEKTGEAKVAFGLNDSVTSFCVTADAFARDGAVGASKLGIESVQPFYAEAKLPLEVTSGDQIMLPVSLVNATGSDLSTPAVNVSLNGDFKLPPLHVESKPLPAGSRVRYIQQIDVGNPKKQSPFTLVAKAGPFADSLTRKLNVKPAGFPSEISFGGLIGPGMTVSHNIVIPKNVVPSSVNSNTAVYPTPLANMTAALERLIQDPYGCFEQTCSTSYPLTMAQQYFVSHTGVDHKLVETSRQKLDAGYKKLVGFWCPDRGYEWFGENPGHEALTAFGLLHFSDMSKVREVDQKMVASTREWLFKQRDGQGGFNRKRRSLHSWIEDKDCSNAYILWSLLETGQPAADLKRELDSLKAASAATNNNYVVALAANAMHLAGDKATAKKLMDRMVARQKPDGSLGGVTSSIVGSGGEALEIEGAALATLAWMREPEYAGSVEKSIKFLADSCKAGRYGSTQSTVLALRAIVAYDKLRSKPKAAGKVRVYVDGQSIGDWSAFTQSSSGPIKLPDLSELLTPGTHKLELKMDGGSPMPYALAVNYNTLTPASSNQCKLDLQVKIAQNKLAEGSSTEGLVTVVNKSKDILPTPVAIIGLPGGLEPRHDQLKELVKKGKIDAYEVSGREVVLYWRTLDAHARLEIPLSLVAAVPGTYTGPASRAYLYYTDEHKTWVDGVRVEISAK